MRNKVTTYVLVAVLALVAVVDVFLWFSWQKSESNIQTGAEVLTNLIQANQSLNEQIITSKDNVTNLENKYQELNLEVQQHTLEKDEEQTKVDLYQSQKQYLEDVLDWYNQRYFLQDVTALINGYAEATGNVEP